MNQCPVKNRRDDNSHAIKNNCSRKFCSASTARPRRHVLAMLLLALDVWLLRSTTGSLSSTTTTGNVMFRVQVYGLSNPETTLKVIDGLKSEMKDETSVLLRKMNQHLEWETEIATGYNRNSLQPSADSYTSLSSDRRANRTKCAVHLHSSYTLHAF
jgi:hypothetical protein